VAVRWLTWAERPELADMGPAAEDVWPEYNLYGGVFDVWWAPLLEELPGFQFALASRHSPSTATSISRPTGSPTSG
jgi:hypothetical protein